MRCLLRLYQCVMRGQVYSYRTNLDRITPVILKHTHTTTTSAVRCSSILHRGNINTDPTSQVLKSTQQNPPRNGNRYFHVSPRRLKRSIPIPVVLEQAETTLTELFIDLNNKYLTDEKWVDLEGTYHQSTEQHKKAQPFDSQAMKILAELDHLQTAESLMDYLKNINLQPSYVAYTHFIAILSRTGDIDKLKGVYDRLVSSYKLVDSTILTSLIYGYSKSDVEWKYCLELLRKFKEIRPPRSRNFNPIICASLRNGDYELALSLWVEMIELNQTPSTDVYCAIMNNLNSDSEQGCEMFIKMLELWREYLIFPDQIVIETLKTWCESKKTESWTGALTKITQRGVCLSCGSKLQQLDLTDDEYNKLKPEVWKKIIEGDDSFRTTTPKEMGKFKRFIEWCGSYDVVVDGLNVGYSIPTINKSNILWQVVKFLAEDCGKKVIVLGRKEMSQNKSAWKPEVMRNIQSLAHCFYASNISSDDPFILYAALFGGKGTYFVSRDMMRDHKFKLGKPYNEYFRRWQHRNQMVLVRMSQYKPVFLPVSYHETVTQVTDNSIHIPYNDGSNAYSDWNLPLSWFCLQKN